MPNPASTVTEHSTEIAPFSNTANSLSGIMLLVARVRELGWFEHCRPEVFSSPPR